MTDLTSVFGDRGGGGEDVALPAARRAAGGDGLEAPHEPRAELDRDAVQRAGAFFWVPPLGEQAFFGLWWSG